MPIYVNRISGHTKIRGVKVSGILVSLFRQEDQLLLRETHSYRGYWNFMNLDPGLYDVQFFGRGVTSDDFLFGIEVVDQVTAGDMTPPISSVVKSVELET